MQRQLFILAIVIAISTFVNGTPFKDCGKTPNIKSVTIKDNGKVCNSPPCELKKGLNASIAVVFTALQDSKTATSKAYGRIGPVPVPYPLPDTDGCKGMSQGSTKGCPIKKGLEYTYNTQLYVKTSFPTIKLAVEWDEVADDGNKLFCLIFAAEVD